MRSIFLGIILFLIFLGLQKQSLSQDTLIHSGDEWKFYDLNIQPDYYWFTENFPDDTWPKGHAPFGYGEGDEATILNFGLDPASKNITVYFRKSFNLGDPIEYFVYLIRIMRDDGAVIYVNGREVWRSNMPEGISITDSTLALTTVSVAQESTFYDFVLSPDNFNKGKNTICVSIHQSRPSSSDCNFDLELIRHNDLYSINRLLMSQQANTRSNNDGFSLLSVQLEIENKNNDINHLKLRNENLFYFSILAVVSFFVLLFVVFYIVIRNLKMSHDYENKKLTVNHELDQKNKDIINYALNVVKLKQFLKLIKEDLNNLSKKFKKENLPGLDLVISKISYHDDHEEEWEQLKAHFDNVHSGFFGRLKDKFPALTQSELQHCSYIKLQLPTKEIARMLNIDPKSVQASRYRIKKKMNLPIESDLRGIIESF